MTLRDSGLPRPDVRGHFKTRIRRSRVRMNAGSCGACLNACHSGYGLEMPSRQNSFDFH